MPHAKRDNATFDPAWTEWSKQARDVEELSKLTQQTMDESAFTGNPPPDFPSATSAGRLPRPKVLTLVEIEQELHRASEEYLAVCELADAADRKAKDTKQRVSEWQRAFDLFFSEMRNSAPPGTQWNPANSSFCRQASANSAGGAAE